MLGTLTLRGGNGSRWPRLAPTAGSLQLPLAAVPFITFSCRLFYRILYLLATFLWCERSELGNKSAGRILRPAGGRTVYEINNQPVLRNSQESSSTNLIDV